MYEENPQNQLRELDMKCIEVAVVTEHFYTNIYTLVKLIDKLKLRIVLLATYPKYIVFSKKYSL